MSATIPLREQFVGAVQQGDAARLRELQSYRAELQQLINAPLFSFDSPAICAVAGRGDVEVVDALLALGADPNARTQWWAGGFHPLYSASGEVAARLLAAGATPDACAAAHLDHIDLLREMLARDPQRVHERGGDGQTPLHFARSREVIDLLLEHGADIDARDVDHRSSAAEWMLGDADDPAKSRLHLARYLVERGATADIFLAAATGDASRVRELLDKSPELLSLRTSQGNYAPRHPSSFHIYQWTIGGNMTPMQTAVRFGREDLLAVMLDYATAEQRLMLACSTGNRSDALAIVRDNPGIISRLALGDKGALADAAWSSNAAAVELMLELGFDPAVPSTSGPGGTALHCAAWEGSVACVEALLRYPAGRALVQVKDPTYHGTPIDWCQHGAHNCGNPQANHSEVERLLRAAMT